MKGVFYGNVEWSGREGLCSKGDGGEEVPTLNAKMPKKQVESKRT